MKDEIKEILKRFEKVNKNSRCPFEMEPNDCKVLLNYITNLQYDVDSYKTKYNNAKNNLKTLQENYVRAMKLVDKEIEKLTSESTEWESKYYDLQKENERIKTIWKDTNVVIRNDKTIVLNQNGFDYLINIEKENERLKENAIHNDKVVDKARWNEMLYKSRNEKAIEYIELWHYRNDFRVNSFTKGVKEDLLNILQGEDDK